MSVVVVGSSLPYPANSGNRIRTLNLLVRLAKRHRITWIGTRTSDRGEARQARTYFNDHGIEVIETSHEVPRKSGMGFHARLAANLASPLPYSVASHHGPALTRAVQAAAARGPVDLWQAEWAGAFLAMRGLPAARRVVMAHNIETLIWERHAEAEPNPIKRKYVQWQARKYAAFERKVFAAADRVVTVSEADASLALSRFGCEHVDVVDNGIDRSFYEGVIPDRDPKRVLFLGSLDWRPNLDALALLLDRIFPEVLARIPDATLDVVGRNPPEFLAQRIAEAPGAALHANVPDVRGLLARSGVMGVPLRIGGGSRLKILEALATGLPVVSSRVGAEGLNLQDGTHLDIVDDASQLAPALILAIQQPGRVQKMARHAQAHVLERYDWDALADALERSWTRCARAVREDRHGPQLIRT